MNFPKKVTFQLIDSSTKKKISGIAVVIVLYARRKNNYKVGPKISDRDGRVFFTIDDCNEAIAISQQLYIMDYSSSLEECLPIASLKILDEYNIDFIIKNFKDYADIWQKHSFYNKNFLSNLKKAKNVMYKPLIFNFEESYLWQSSLIKLQLEKK